MLTINNSQDVLAGVIQINCSGETKHDGINISAEGTVNLLMSNKNVGLLEAFSNSVKVRLAFSRSTTLKQINISIIFAANSTVEQPN